MFVYQMVTPAKLLWWPLEKNGWSFWIVRFLTDDLIKWDRHPWIFVQHLFIFGIKSQVYHQNHPKKHPNIIKHRYLMVKCMIFSRFFPWTQWFPTAFHLFPQANRHRVSWASTDLREASKEAFMGASPTSKGGILALSDRSELDCWAIFLREKQQ